MRYLYALFLALDANFRLKRKNVSSDEADPGLSKGWHTLLKRKSTRPIWNFTKPKLNRYDFDFLFLLK